MAKRYYWLKLKEDFFRNKIIKKLRQVAGGDTYVIIYLKLQLLSLQNEGILIYEGLENTFSKELALEIDEDDVDIDFLIHFLTQSNVLIETKENEFSLTQVGLAIGSESASAQRVREHREREKIKQLDAPKKKQYLEKVKLFDDEYAKLLSKLGQPKLDKYIENLNNYIGSTGKKYKSHYHTILTWYNKDNKQPNKSNDPDWLDKVRERF